MPDDTAPDASNLEEPDDRFHRLALSKIIAEWREGSIGIFDQVIALKPMAEQGGGGCGRAGILVGSPGKHLLSYFCNKRRQQFLVGRAAKRFVGRKPSLLGNER